MKRPKDLNYAKWLCQYYLGHRMHTKKELREKLFRKEIERGIIDEALMWCEDEGYINDEDFAMRFIKDGVELKKRGKRRLTQEMRFKGVAQEVIDKAFMEVEGEVDFDEALMVALEKKARGLDLGDRKDRDRIVRHLAGKGFNIGEIIKGIEKYREKLSEE